MPKHKLYLEAECSPRFSSSVEEDAPPGGKKLCKVNPGAKKDKMPASKGVNHLPSPKPSTSAVTQNNNVSPRKKVLNEQTERNRRPQSDSDEDLIFESMDVPGFFGAHNQKLPYSFEEDEEIVKFVLSCQNVFRASSVALWKELSARKSKPKRTFQSLKNRFLRNIKPNLFTVYSHLIPDKEVKREILTKFPELKHQRCRGETLQRIKLPRRIPLNIPEERINSPGRQQNSAGIPAPREEPEIAPGFISFNPHYTEKLNFHRKVKSLKEKNKLVRCSACGNYRSNDPDADRSPDSSAESDAFISNSLESKKNSGKKDSRSRREVETKGAEELNPIPKSGSQSLLDDVNEVAQLDENEGGNAEKNNEGDVGEEKETAAAAGNSDPIVSEEADQPASTDKETECIYKSAVEEFRNLIDSDEEEILVKRCLRKNRRTIGFDANLSVEEMRVDSFFIEANSPTMGSEQVSSSLDGKTGSSSSSVLYQNMMNMMEKRVAK